MHLHLTIKKKMSTFKFNYSYKSKRVLPQLIKVEYFSQIHLHHAKKKKGVLSNFNYQTENTSVSSKNQNLS